MFHCRRVKGVYNVACRSRPWERPCLRLPNVVGLIKEPLWVEIRSDQTVVLKGTTRSKLHILQYVYWRMKITFSLTEHRNRKCSTGKCRISSMRLYVSYYRGTYSCSSTFATVIKGTWAIWSLSHWLTGIVT